MQSATLIGGSLSVEDDVEAWTAVFAMSNRRVRDDETKQMILNRIFQSTDQFCFFVHVMTNG